MKERAWLFLIVVVAVGVVWLLIALTAANSEDRMRWLEQSAAEQDSLRADRVYRDELARLQARRDYAAAHDTVIYCYDCPDSPDVWRVRK